MKIWIKRACTCLFLLCLGTAACAWPDRPIRVIVPYGAGGMGDIVIRLLAEEMRGGLGQSLVIENRPGAGGNIGAAAVARAPADGYTFMVAPTNNLVVNQFLYKNLSFDPLKAFEPVTLLVQVPSVLFVHPQAGRTYAEFVAQARASRGRMSFGSPGSGTTPHLSLQAINQSQALGMVHVPFQGAVPAMTSLLAQDIHAYIGGAGLGLQHVQTGKLVAAAVSAEKRLAVLPDTPTFQEVGLGEIKAANWWALVAPQGTKEDVIERMNAALRDAMRRPGVQERFEKLGVLASPMTPRATAQFLAEEAVFWKKAVNDSGVSLE
jgi:tripartite-type tricarboxylate transporter receptor subunit TctC